MLTQKIIDLLPTKYFAVDEPTLPFTWKRRLANPWDPDGDRSECIPGEDIIAMLRRVAETQGKRVLVTDARGKPRWAKQAAMGLLVLVTVFFVIGLLANLVKP